MEKKVTRRVSWLVEATKKKGRAAAAVSSSSDVIGSHGLTAIVPKQIAGVRGNVHTGATPPWLRGDDAGPSAPSVIGPSVDEFILHRERKKRAGKDPRRVGADFHIKLATQKHPDSDNWLPAFGRVWNHGPRLHSKKEYLLEMNPSDSSSASTNTATPPSAHPVGATPLPSTQPSSVAHDTTACSQQTTPPIQHQLKGDPIAATSCRQLPGVPESRLPSSTRSHDLLGELSQSSVVSKSLDSLKRSHDMIGRPSQDSHSLEAINEPHDSTDGTTWLGYKRQKPSKAETGPCIEVGYATGGAIPKPSTEARPVTFSMPVTPYVKRRIWDAESQKFVVNQKLKS